MTATWNGKRLSATEAADSLAVQVVVAARKAFEHRLAIGCKPSEIRLDGALLIEEILSEAAGGHLGPYLRACTQACALPTVRKRVKELAR